MKDTFDTTSTESIDSLDDLPLWSAPFGLELINTIDYKKNMTVLDIGCGCGFPTLELAERLGNSCKIIGVDPWEEALQRARRKMNIRGITNVEFIKSEAENLPIENNSIDLVVSNNGINNVFDIDKSFSEISRVMKHDSEFVFTVNLPETMFSFYEAYFKILEKFNLTKEIELLNQHIFEKRKSFDWYVEHLSAHGFKIEHNLFNNFQMKYVDGTAFLNHSFINFFFKPAWENILKEELRSLIFGEIEELLNSKVINKIGIKMFIPFVCFDCRKEI